MGIFNPYRWNDEQEDQYWNVFKSWDAEKWNKSCDAIILSNKKMPVPAELRLLNVEVHAENTNFERESCSRCVDGLVWLDTPAINGVIYTKMFGCDCPAGRHHQELLLNSARQANPRIREPRQMSIAHYCYQNDLPVPNAPEPPAHQKTGEALAPVAQEEDPF